MQSNVNVLRSYRNAILPLLFSTNPCNRYSAAVCGETRELRIEAQFATCMSPARAVKPSARSSQPKSSPANTGEKNQNVMQKLSLQKQSENASETLHVREPLTMQTFYALSEVNPAQTSLEDAYCIRMGLFNAMVNYTQRNSM